MTSPPNPNIIPRYTNIASFYRLPIYNDTLELPDDKKTIGIIGIPFDGGCTFRPGARFGPEAVRNASRIVRPYSLFHKIDLFNKYNCIDLGDIITNPFNISKTIDMINKETIEYLPKGAVITNVARGDIIDDDALIDALDRRKIYAVGLDVYKNEPNLNPGYLKHKSAFILPHLGSATKETRTAMANLAIDNIDEFFNTGNCKNKVN